MFFNAHVYHSIKRNNGAIESERILGAILADSALTGVVSWTDLHDKEIIDRFGQQLGSSPTALRLVAGLRDHYTLDLVSHESYAGGPGYAFARQTAQLVDLVAQACQLNDQKRAQNIAHNFIESAVDIHLLGVRPEIQDQLRQAVKDMDTTFIANHIATFFKQEPADISRKLTDCLTLATAYDLSLIDQWTDLWSNIIALLLDTAADKSAIKTALLLAVDLTAADYQRAIAAS